MGSSTAILRVTHVPPIGQVDYLICLVVLSHALGLLSVNLLHVLLPAGPVSWPLAPATTLALCSGIPGPC
jgi:hypothetical protein